MPSVALFVSALLMPTRNSKTLRFPGGKRIETRLQSFLQVFQNQWNETHISDFVFRKSFAARIRDAKFANARPRAAP